jgi:YVTN family beta-propeller protein
MNFRRVIGFSLAVALALLAVACDDTFRPIVIPLNPNPPSGQLLHFAVFLSTNGPQAPGDSSVIDVSGDTNVGSTQMGVGPVHGAVLSNGSEAYIANNLDDSVTAYNPSPLATTAPIVVSLPPGSAPVFVGTTEIAHVYVANSGNGTVADIDTATNVATIIPLATNSTNFDPVALAETPDGSKVYVANEGNNSVSVITTSDLVAQAPIAVGTSPVWVAMRSDGRRAYVLNSGSGTISTLDTSTDTVLNTVPVSAGASYMFYDSVLNRLYVTSPASTTLNIFNVSNDQPSVLASVDLTAATGTLCGPGCVPTSVTSLPDGTRAYVSFYTVGGTPSTLNAGVAVINTGTNAITKFVALPSATVDTTNATGCSTARFRIFVAAAPDSSRVYVSDCDAGNTGIVQTSDDTFVLNLPAPVSVFGALPSTGFPPPQNPVFVFPGK